ncbi:MAG: Type 1 glutamine amidotransferase-like domain-containing protein [Oscillospiraceae bacterium]|nr:Type 1 glutamine amidotransferase-like domain-containing protein [Oscillospiraceae bacterium]
MNAKEVYLIPGGRLGDIKQTTEDFRAALIASGKPHPKVAYIGTASSDNKVFFHIMKTPVLSAGAKEVTLVPIIRKNADIDNAKRILTDADVVFLGGGEVEDGIVWLEKTNLIGFITDLYHGGKLFIGTSAGAIMMGRYWVHWDVEGDDSTSSLFPCLNLVPFTFDAHGEKENWIELKCALRLLGPGAKGYGLSTGGFFSADESGQFTSFRNNPALFQNVSGKIEGITAE